MKKRGRKESLVDTPLDRLSEKETLMHYNAVLMEDIKSKFELIIEGMESMRVEFDQKLRAMQIEIDSLRTYMDRRFSMLKKALHSLKEDVIELDHRLTSKIDGLSDRCDRLDARSMPTETVT